MSVSPAASEVGSPTAIVHALKCAHKQTSPKSVLDAVTSNGIGKGIISKAKQSNTLKHSKRIELDRADLDFDWRSSSRLSSGSVSGKDEAKAKKSDDKTNVEVYRADQDLNWRDHDDPRSNSPVSSLSSHGSSWWESKKARKYQGFLSGKISSSAL